MGEETEVEYIVSTYPSKFSGYQSKKGKIGKVKLFISNIWNESKDFNIFFIDLNWVLICERYCLERAFNKIRIKGGACNPCCIEKLTTNTINYLFADFMNSNKLFYEKKNGEQHS